MQFRDLLFKSPDLYTVGNDRRKPIKTAPAVNTTNIFYLRLTETLERDEMIQFLEGVLIKTNRSYLKFLEVSLCGNRKLTTLHREL